MTLTKKQHISLKLSLYLDGQLSASGRAEIEAIIASNPSVHEEYEALCASRALLTQREAIPENPFLPERVMNRIRLAAEEEEERLPVARRFMPVVAGLAMVVLAAIATFAWLQREDIFRYVENTGTQMQQAYEESILKGWIMPLFERTDRDEVLQFAMFGTLPLNDEEGTVLRVDEHADSGYRVQLASTLASDAPQTTLDELYSEIRPTESQRRVFDTLFSYAQKQIESSVLMNEEKELAIDPAISKYHKVILSGIAASLEPEQLARFEYFLQSRNTPYTFVSHTGQRFAPPPPPRPHQVIEHFRTVRMPEEFVVFTRDSISYARLHLDMDSLRRLMKIMEHRMPRFDVAVNDIARAVTVRSGSGQNALPEQSVRVMSRGNDQGGHVITISIKADADAIMEMESEMQEMMQEVAILKREKAHVLREAVRHRSPSRGARSCGVDLRVLPEAEIQVNVTIDSMTDGLLEQFDKMELDLEFDHHHLFEGDSSLQFFWRQAIPDDQHHLIDSLLDDHNQLLQELPRQLRMEIEREMRSDYEIQKRLAPPEQRHFEAPGNNRDRRILVVPPAPHPPRPSPPASNTDSLREI